MVIIFSINHPVLRSRNLFHMENRLSRICFLSMERSYLVFLILLLAPWNAFLFMKLILNLGHARRICDFISLQHLREREITGIHPSLNLFEEPFSLCLFIRSVLRFIIFMKVVPDVN